MPDLAFALVAGGVWLLTVLGFLAVIVLKDRAHEQTVVRLSALERNPAAATRIAAAPEPRPPKQPASLTDEEQAAKEMRARGLDPAKMDDRAEFLQRAALRR